MNNELNLSIIHQIACALEEMNERVVFVGGAVVGCYCNDSAAEDVRPTKDIDISMEIVTLTELEKTRQELISKGFSQSPEDEVMCRFRYNEFKVDVMSTKEVGWAPANPWFAPGFQRLERYTIKDKFINLLPLAYFIATKFVAFHDRGSGDPRTSHDFEDITYILNNRNDFAEVIINSPDNVNKYLKREFIEIMNNELYQEAIIGNLEYSTQTKRFEIIMEKLKNIIDHI